HTIWLRHTDFEDRKVLFLFVVLPEPIQTTLRLMPDKYVLFSPSPICAQPPTNAMSPLHPSQLYTLAHQNSLSHDSEPPGCISRQALCFVSHESTNSNRSCPHNAN